MPERRAKSFATVTRDMATEEKEITEVRDTDGKLERRLYDAGVKRRARLMWCLLGVDSKVEDWMGLPQRTLSKWRERKQPDGLDWYEFREELNISERSREFGLAQPRNEVELYEQHVEWARRILSVTMAALETSELFDEAGKPVKFLYRADGRKVHIRGIQPTSMSQVTEAVKQMTGLIEKSMDRLAGLRVHEDQTAEYVRRVMEIMFNAVNETLGLNQPQREKVERALREAGHRAGRMALTAGTQEESAD